MVLKRADVVKLTGCCYSTIRKMEINGEFPARRRISASRVGWLLSEVEAWAKKLPKVAA